MHSDDGLTDFLSPALFGHFGWIFNHHYFTITFDHLVHHAGRGGDEILVKFALQPLLYDFHVQKAEKATTETKTQRLRNFGLVVQTGVVELELFQ